MFAATIASMCAVVALSIIAAQARHASLVERPKHADDDLEKKETANTATPVMDDEPTLSKEPVRSIDFAWLSPTEKQSLERLRELKRQRDMAYRFGAEALPDNRAASGSENVRYGQLRADLLDPSSP